MVKSIYLHIGLPRCASTAIETEFVYPGRKPYEALRRSGVKPLLRLYKEFRRALATPRWNDVFGKRLRDYHLEPLLAPDAESEVRGYFVTDEGLTHISDQPDDPSIFADRAKFCGKLFEGFKPTILMMVRNQVSYVESLYGLHVQNGGTKDFTSYYESFPLERFDWLSIADVYAQVFGEENVKVFPLERQLYGNSSLPYDDFVHALIAAMGIDERINSDNLALLNPSLDRNLLPAQVEINRVFEPEIARGVLDILISHASKRRGATLDLLSPDEVQDIREKFHGSNKELFQRFMPKVPMDGYLPT